MSRAWHDVASLDQLERDGVVIARPNEREVGVPLDRRSGRQEAIRNRCLHMGAPGCRVLHCPWHGWEFDPESGVCPEHPRMRDSVYPVRVENGRVLVEA